MANFQSSSDNGRSSTEPLVVFKFGGTSVGSVGRLRRVVETVTRTAQSARVLVVNSALSNVTRQLADAFDAFAADGGDRAGGLDELIETLRRRHRDQAASALSPDAQMGYASIVEKRLARLRETFEQVERDGGTPALRDAVLAAGEQLAVPMVALALEDAGLEAPQGDATQLLRTDATFGAAVVDRTATAAALRGWYGRLPSTAVPVLAGFIGGTADGRTTTLGFEGSDYSAALFAALLNADVLVRYTDVDGLYTCDPRTHDEAERIARLSMEDALSLTEAGQLGMHPKTLRPLVEAGIPLHIRSIDDPAASGTQIVPAEQMASPLSK